MSFDAKYSASFMQNNCHHFGDPSRVNVTNLDTSTGHRCGDNAGIMKDKYPNGLRAAMERKNLGPTELAERAGTNKQNVARWADGERELTPHWAKKLAPHLGSSPESLVFDDLSFVEAPMISWVTAGNPKTPEAVTDLENAKMVAAPGLNPKGDWIALRVEGASMDRISPPDSVIFVNRADKRLVQNACYVIADDDGTATYKRYRVTAKGEEFQPVAEDMRPHKTIRVRNGVYPKIIGRVRKTVLDL